jgi:hypothetical protein
VEHVLPLVGQPRLLKLKNGTSWVMDTCITWQHSQQPIPFLFTWQLPSFFHVVNASSSHFSFFLFFPWLSSRPAQLTFLLLLFFFSSFSPAASLTFPAAVRDFQQFWPCECGRVRAGCERELAVRES